VHEVQTGDFYGTHHNPLKLSWLFTSITLTLKAECHMYQGVCHMRCIFDGYHSQKSILEVLMSWKTEAASDHLKWTMRRYCEVADDALLEMESRLTAVGFRHLSAIFTQRATQKKRKYIDGFKECHRKEYRNERVLTFIESSHYLDERLRRGAIRLALREIREAIWGTGGPVGRRLHMWRDQVREVRKHTAACAEDAFRKKRKEVMAISGSILCKSTLENMTKSSLARLISRWRSANILMASDVVLADARRELEVAEGRILSISAVHNVQLRKIALKKLGFLLGNTQKVKHRPNPISRFTYIRFSLLCSTMCIDDAR